jgi:hypothetical protein
MTTATDIETILNGTTPREPGECHSIDKRGYAYCGARTKNEGKPGGSHSHKECVRRGHKHCLICDQIWPQLGDDFRVA